jgi:hypothetical protein
MAYKFTDADRAKATEKRLAAYERNKKGTVEVYFGLREKGIQPYRAAEEAGLSRSELKRRWAEDPAWCEREDEADEVGSEVLVDALIQTGKAGSVAAIRDVLSQRSKRRWEGLQPKPQQVTNIDARSITVGDTNRADFILEMFERLEHRRALMAGDPDAVEAHKVQRDAEWQAHRNARGGGGDVVDV